MPAGSFNRKIKGLEGKFRELADLPLQHEISYRERPGFLGASPIHGEITRNYRRRHRILGASAIHRDTVGNLEEYILLTRLYTGLQREEARVEGGEKRDFSRMTPEGRISSIVCHTTTSSNQLPDITTRLDTWNREIEDVENQAFQVYLFLNEVKDSARLSSREEMVRFLKEKYGDNSIEEYSWGKKIGIGKGDAVTVREKKVKGGPAYALKVRFSVPSGFYCSPTTSDFRMRKENSQAEAEEILEVHLSRLEKILDNPD